MGMPPVRRRRFEQAVVAAATTRVSPLLRVLPPDDLVTLVRASHGVTGRRGDRIASSFGDRVTVILEGVAAGLVVTSQGEHLVRGLYGPGDTHGLTTALGHPGAADELVAVEPTDALSLPASAIRDLVGHEPAAARACLEMVAAAHAAALEEHTRFAASTTTARVEERLLELADRFGQRDGKRILIQVGLTQEELASWAGTSRESIAKVLHTLRKAGIVTTGRRRLVIDDPAALRARRAEASDPTVAAVLRAIG